jgi:NADH dehydrogenase [ubiquinone] 1 alpha subcomplex assembly factor 7
VTTRLSERIRREGPIPFDAFVEDALYDEQDGFFAGGGGAGRAGRDFVTSPEVGTLFGLLVARALDAWWRDLGEPDPYVVVDAGAGRGRLAADVLRAPPDCAAALRYVLVERTAALRAAQRDLVDLEPAERALGPAVRADPDDTMIPVAGTGPLATAIADLPAIDFDGVVVANELLDNLPFRLVERSATGWSEVRVGLDGDQLVEVLVPAPPDVRAEAERVAAGTAERPGTRLPVPTATVDWLFRCGKALRRGFLLVVDYAADAASLASRGQEGWLRTYRQHGRGAGPLTEPGAQDITCDVPVEHLLAAARAAGFTLVEHTTQVEWLRALGVVELAAAAAAAWRERAGVGDLEAVAARSRVHEADALTDPSGLGAHHVFVFEKGR